MNISIDHKSIKTRLYAQINLLAVIATNVFFPGGDSAQVIHLMDVDCTGNEARLSDCLALDFDAGSMCDSSRAVGLICNVPQRKALQTKIPVYRHLPHQIFKAK